MRIIITVFALIITAPAFAQQIVNLVLVGEKGITEDIKEARSFIVIKQYPNGFQRLDYNLGAPLERLRTYSDSTLTVLKGPFYEYSSAGTITKSGYYINNMKERDWYYYNDTGKVILEEKYEKGELAKTIRPDTMKHKPLDDKFHDGEREAVFKKGDREWIKYLSKNINAEVGMRSVRGGRVVVMFVVNTSGKCVDVHLAKSVEFVLDEEAIRVIENSPPWEPAFQNGKRVNAYRRQPISFGKPE